MECKLCIYRVKAFGLNRIFNDDELFVPLRLKLCEDPLQEKCYKEAIIVANNMLKPFGMEIKNAYVEFVGTVNC